MSERIPESIPTSQDPRSKRPVKRHAPTPTSAQANAVSHLFANPDRDISIPSSSSSKKRSLPPPPEIVANVQGSSAGAGSGEFHVYKAARRREYERLKQMEEESSKEVADREFEEAKARLRREDGEKTEKNRAKRRGKNKKKTKARTQASGAPHSALVTGVGHPDGEASHGNEAIAAKSTSKTNGTTELKGDAHNGQGDSAREAGIIIHDED